MTKNSFNFKVGNKHHEVFFADDGHIEIYEVENPGKTGYFFNDIKELNFFINSLSDIAIKEGI
jgi:hypothetical protein